MNFLMGMLAGYVAFTEHGKKMVNQTMKQAGSYLQTYMKQNGIDLSKITNTDATTEPSPVSMVSPDVDITRKGGF